MKQNISANIKTSRLLDFYGKLLTERQEDICRMYFNDDLSLSEISEEVGITRQGVRDSIKKGEAALNDFENKLGLLSKFEEMQSDVQKIIDRVKSIDGVSDEETAGIEAIAQRFLS